MIINGYIVNDGAYNHIYNKGYADGSLAVTSEILNEFVSRVKPRLTDAICERHVEGVCNLMNDVVKEMRCNDVSTSN